MDKNIAALLREDAKTVRVRFYKPEPDAGGFTEENPPHPSRYTSQGDYVRACREFKRTLMSAGKLYTYVTDLPVSPGDLVMVYARGFPNVVLVEEVDSKCCIEPNDPTKYQWIVQKIDLDYFNKLTTSNEEITEVVADAYKANLRKSFTQQILAGLEDSQQLRLTTLLKGE